MARAIDADQFMKNFDKEIENGATDAFDAVEDALEKTPTIEPKQEWISVKDRMPERNELVLVCAASTARGGKIRFVGAYDGFWFLQTAADTIGLTIQYDVTHWMPLPEPPKDGE